MQWLLQSDHMHACTHRGLGPQITIRLSTCMQSFISVTRNISAQPTLAYSESQ